MSLYDPIWNNLKLKGRIDLVANPKLHARIIKAVKKRKWLDMSYKLQIEPNIAFLGHARDGNKLTFILRIQPQLTYIQGKIEL